MTGENKNIPMKTNERVDRMGTNIYSSQDNQSLHKSLNGEFLLYQILLKQILDENNSYISSPLSLLKHFKPNNPKDETAMNEFDFEYQSPKAIHWYTRDTCIYQILNKALRTQNIDDIKPFNILIRDLNKQLKDEHHSFVQKQTTSFIQLYRGQLISKDELNRLKQGINQFISMNSFLSTSRNREKALQFATSRPPPNDQLTTILLEIEADLNTITRPFADIKHLSAFAEEEEILFMFGCVFRIENIHYDDQFKLWIAKLKLCSETDQDYQDFSSNLEKDLNGQNQFISLGNYYIQMHKYQQAEEHFQQILNEKLTNDHIELAFSYYGLSQVNQKKEDFHSAILNLNQVLDHLLKYSSNDDHPLVSQSYNDLGSIYTKQDNYFQAFHFYEKALQRKTNILFNTYSGLSQIQFKLKNYSLAQDYLEKALDHQPETNHASIASHYIDMGKIFLAMNDKDKAQQMFDKAIQTQLKVLTADHPDLAYTYMALGLMYSDIDDEQKAFQYIDKAYQLQLESLPGNHPDFAQIFQIFGQLYLKKEDFDQSLIYQHKALDNQLKTLLWNHPQVAETYRMIGSIHWKKKDYDQALIYFHKVLDSELSRKKFGDPTLNKDFRNLADLYYEKDDLDQSLVFYHKLLDNQFHSKLYEDILLTDVYKIIASIYYKKRLLSKALIYYYRLLDCYLQKPTYDQTKIDEVYSIIGKVYLKKHHFDQILKTKIISDDVDDIHFSSRHLDEALIYFEKFLKQQLKTNSKDHSSLSDIYQILGNISYEKGKLDEAFNYFDKSLNIQLKRKSVEDRSLTKLYRIIGKIYFEKEMYNQSLSYFNRLIDCQLLKSQSNSSILKTYQLIGEIYLKKDNINQSSNYIDQLINQTNFQFEKRHLELNLFHFQNLLNNKSFEDFTREDIYFIIANLYLEKQDLNQALFFFQKRISFFDQTNSSHYFSLAKTNEIVAQIYQKQFNFNQSLQYYQQALYFYQQLNPFNHVFLNHIKQQINQILSPNK